MVFDCQIANYFNTACHATRIIQTPRLCFAYLELQIKTTSLQIYAQHELVNVVTGMLGPEFKQQRRSILVVRKTSRKLGLSRI